MMRRLWRKWLRREHKRLLWAQAQHFYRCATHHRGKAISKDTTREFYVDAAMQNACWNRDFTRAEVEAIVAEWEL